jgi:UDP-glucose 4-epimerase
MGRYLVTGGAGFVGSNIVAELLKRGEYVRVLDNFSTGRKENLSPFLKDIEVIEGDLCSYHIVQKAVRQIDYVLHQGALPSVPRSLNDPITTHQVNATGTLLLLHAATEAHVKRLVYASSSSVYGDGGTLPRTESQLPNPKSPYAVSKLCGEQYCRVFHQRYGLQTVALRYFNVFGPRQDPNSEYAAVIPKFMKLLMRDASPIIYGDGLQTRDFTFIQNVVEANLLACDAPNVAGKAFNIACGNSYSLNDLVSKLNTILGKNIPAHYGEERSGDVLHSLADITSAKEELMYQPLISFEKGLELTYQHAKEYGL